MLPEYDLCEQCGEEEGCEDQVCPYDEEINDRITICNCCEACTYECNMAI